MVHSDTAAISATDSTVNATLIARGLPYSAYSSKPVSWDDVSRGTVGPHLSCLGSNITDTYLKTKGGAALYTVRPDNWNEKLGVVRARDIALQTGNCDGAVPATNAQPGAPVSTSALRPVTLQDFLSRPAAYGAAYTGIAPDASLLAPALDDKVSIRFQTVFLPLAVDSNEQADDATPTTTATAGAAASRPRVQFAAEMYHYQTVDSDSPRNLLLLASSQGIAMQPATARATRVLHHARDRDGKGPARAFWLEAESSRHAVGTQQADTAAERAEALARGKAASEKLGIRAMGNRFNALLTVQIPLEETRRLRPQQYAGRLIMDEVQATYPLVGLASTSSAAAMPSAMMSETSKAASVSWGYLCDSPPPPPPPALSSGRGRGRVHRRIALNRLPASGKARAARVSRGDEEGDVKPLAKKRPERHECEHLTVTVVLYHTVQGGVPGEADVIAAVDELEALYAACDETGRLAEAGFDFMTKPLSVAEVEEIQRKVMSQPVEV